MTNPLTGDFDAVLQLSSSTINRLLASMHQNAFANPEKPSFPHSIQVRLGDERLIDGVRGTVKAQIGLPQVELIDGSTDRFWIVVPLRARYVPDLGTQPLPAFINGTVRAQYRIQDIDPHCFGWSAKADKFLWVKVVRDSVRFQGTTADEVSPLDGPSHAVVSGAVEDHAAVEARITRQITALLLTKFATLPHPVSDRFRRGAMRTIAPSAGDAAVVVPLAVNGPPAGDIASVGQVFLETADFAVATNRDLILALAEPLGVALRGIDPTIKVHVSTPSWSPIPDIDTVYRVTVDPPSIAWEPHGSFAVIKVKFGGSATTDSVLPNATLSVEQDITLNFDGGSESLWLSAGTRKVDAHVGGPFGGFIEGMVKNEVDKAVKSFVEGACTDAQPALGAMIAQKQQLTAQLQTLDALADARITDATFLIEGIILRGRIALTPRRRAAVEFEQIAEQDGFTAIQAFIPGGRIDKFEWSWRWFGGRNPGSTAFYDRFVLRRPSGKVGRWGQGIGLVMPLPGLDGLGTVCLQIEGVQMDAVTGEFHRVSGTRCQLFGVGLYAVEGTPRSVFVPHPPELSQDVPFPQLGSIDLVGNPQAAPLSNALVLYAGDGTDERLVPTLAEALHRVQRNDVGLVLLVVVQDGRLAGGAGRVLEEIDRLGETIGLATVIGEDRGGEWAATLGLADRPHRRAWRLIGPDGVVRWKHDDDLDGPQLVTALERHLISSLPPKPERIVPAFEVGKRVGGHRFRPDVLGQLESTCPPLPLGQAGIGGTIVVFVQQKSLATLAHLSRIAERAQAAGPAAPSLVVVVDRASRREADALRDELGFDFVALADSNRSVTSSFGVRVWPTTVTLDSTGLVTDVEMGVDHVHGDTGYRSAGAV